MELTCRITCAPPPYNLVFKVNNFRVLTKQLMAKLLRLAEIASNVPRPIFPE